MRVFCCLLAGTVLVSCTSGPPKSRRSSLIKDPIVSNREIRLRLYDFVKRFGGEVAEASFEIERETTDPVIRRRALMWKMNAIPVCHQIAFGDDSLTAFADVWAFTIQMRDFFEEGKGKEGFGPYQSRVLEVSRTLVAEITGVAHEAEGPNVEIRLCAPGPPRIPSTTGSSRATPSRRRSRRSGATRNGQPSRPCGTFPTNSRTSPSG